VNDVRTYEIPEDDGEIIKELKERIAELERKYSAACDRNQELEGELARLTRTYYLGDEGETY